MSYILKRFLRLGIVFLTIGGLFFSQKNNTPPPVREEPATKRQETSDKKKETRIYYSVVRVIDGDTIVIEMNGAYAKTEAKVRLIGLDTPETVDPRKPVQCFGIQASDKAKSILAGQKVKIETDPTQGARDKYGRLLAYVFLPDGALFNKMMIEEGYGHEYTYRLPYRYQKEFKAAEVRARELKKGLWADGICD